MNEERALNFYAPNPSRRNDWSDYVFGVATMLENSGLWLFRPISS